MNLHAALQLANVQKATKETKEEMKSALEVARKVFALAAVGGHPYKDVTAAQWAKKWLGSSHFVLVDFPIHFAACPNKPLNQAKVLAHLRAAVEQFEPIVVDVNVQQVGRAFKGFVPPVIVVDGKHRHTAQSIRGCETIRAWVGTEALKKVKIEAHGIMQIKAEPQKTIGKMERAMRLHSRDK